ncbi:transferase [Mycobacteroides abscessus subsp. abscessus]|nr:transferase [Mycobacteroides abscessus subsp. abscessus]
MQRAINALKVILSIRAWRHIAAVITFFGLDTVEQDRITKGRSVGMSPTVSVRNGANISIGAGSRIGQGCHLWAGDDSRILIGDHALFGPNVFVTATNYRFDNSDGPVMDCGRRGSDITIGSNTWIGTGVVIVAGAHIGDGAIIAAGAVVSGDIPPMSVAGGIPARVIRQRGV